MTLGRFGGLLRFSFDEMWAVFENQPIFSWSAFVFGSRATDMIRGGAVI
jgi:hypothetical protein